MFESTAECIANCLQTVPGTYPLAVEFGVSAVDDPASNPRRRVQIQLAKYYPGVTARNVTITAQDGGYFTVAVDLQGVE